MTLRRLMKRLASVKAEEEELQAGGHTAGAPETAQVTTLTLPTLDTMGVMYYQPWARCCTSIA